MHEPEPRRRTAPTPLSDADERVRAAELIAALSLATDLGTGLPLEHGLESTLFAMRLGERLGIDDDVARQTYYACLLFYIGCTAEAEITAELFPGDDALVTHFTPVMFGSPRELLAGLMRAVAVPGTGPLTRALRILRTLPRAALEERRHSAAICEVARMLTRRLGLPASVQALFVGFTERWDGKGAPHGLAGDEIPLPVRITHVARDAAFHRMLGGHERAARVVRERAGRAFDPEVAACLADNAAEILVRDPTASAWDRTLAREPRPHVVLRGAAIDRALAAMGDFADLISPHLSGHAARVCSLADVAARRYGLGESDAVACRRAACVHDLGRVAVPARIWNKPDALTADEWERVRLHAYHSERFLLRSPFLAGLGAIAGRHHERLDGSGYHRGAAAPAIPHAARLLAVADGYTAMTAPRPHRPAIPPGRAAEILGREVAAGRLDADAVAAVLDAAGQPTPALERPAGLTEREAEVIGLLARALKTKQIARTLGISAKTADRHIQNAYRKIGVSTRVAAALFAMEHGLVTWGDFPIVRGR
ncbi:MAG: HD domain-containing phosphohydrolase [Gemmatimonadota bacterium]